MTHMPVILEGEIDLLRGLGGLPEAYVNPETLRKRHMKRAKTKHVYIPYGMPELAVCLLYCIVKYWLGITTSQTHASFDLSCVLGGVWQAMMPSPLPI